MREVKEKEEITGDLGTHEVRSSAELSDPERDTSLFDDDDEDEMEAERRLRIKLHKYRATQQWEERTHMMPKCSAQVLLPLSLVMQRYLILYTESHVDVG